jgi:uncharacterized protein YkwD
VTGAVGCGEEKETTIPTPTTSATPTLVLTHTSTPTLTPTPTTTPTLTPTLAEQQTADVDIPWLEKRIHDLTNAERSTRELSLLEWNVGLSSIARKHSQDMAKRGYFSHTSPEGYGPCDRYRQEGFVIRKIPAGNNYYYLGCSENIFLCSLVERDWYVGGVYSHSEYYTQEEIATLVVEGWMDSPGHKENILTEYWESEGIGIAISSDGQVYVTQNFS